MLLRGKAVPRAAPRARANLPGLAGTLVAGLQLTALPDGHKARGWDIKRWRYRLFATAGKIITRARRNHLLLPAAAPEQPLISALLEAIERIAAAANRPAVLLRA